MKSTTIIAIGAVAGMLAVMLGAFGAHALQETLRTNGRLSTYETAVQYHFYHALALLATGILMQYIPGTQLAYAGLCFAGGIVIFSGSLYVLSTFNITWLGAITPLGGVLFIAGWLMILLGVLPKK